MSRGGVGLVRFCVLSSLTVEQAPLAEQNHKIRGKVLILLIDQAVLRQPVVRYQSHYQYISLGRLPKKVFSKTQSTLTPYDHNSSETLRGAEHTGADITRSV